MHAGGCARNRRQETNVLIVSVLFAVVVNLALRSKAQGSIEVVGMCKLTIMVGLGAFPVTIMGDPEIEDEVPRPSRVLEVANNLDVPSFLSRGVTRRDAELRSHLMTGRAEERPKNRYHPVAPWWHLSELCMC